MKISIELKGITKKTCLGMRMRPRTSYYEKDMGEWPPARGTPANNALTREGATKKYK